ncbi:MAG: hypothetical protein AAF266_11020 [Planctomycetota bacterium]
MPTRTLFAALAFGVMTAACQATPLSITNPSFEDLALGEEGFLFTIPGWTNTGDSGTYNPSTANYPGPVPDGNNVAFSAVGGPWISQVLTDTVEAETPYELTVQIGRRRSISVWPGYVVELRAGGSVLASDNSAVVPALGTFEPSVISYTAMTGNPAVGEPLEIRFRSLGPQVNFDAVTLRAIPEPMSGLLALMTAVSIASWRRA